MKDSILKNKIYMIISIAVILLLWTVISHIVDNSVKLPTPFAVAKAFLRIISGEHFYVQVFNTLKRFLFSFMISFLGGIIIGIAAGVLSPLYYLLQPIVIIQRAIPTMAVILLSLIWLDNEIAPILVCVLIIFPIIYSSVVAGIRDIDKKLLEMTEVYHFGTKKKLKHLYLPSISRSLMAVSATALSLNIKITIAAEVLSQPKYAIGTGFILEKVALETAGVMAWAVIAIFLASFFEWLIKIIFQKVYHKRLS